MIKINVRFIKRLSGSPEGDYSIFAAELVDYKDAHLIKENKYGNFTISGNYSLYDNELGKIQKVTMEEDVTSRYPSSYKLLQFHYEFPDSAKEQWKYLKSGNVVPLATYLSIESAFKKTDKILDIMIDSPNLLTKVRGIGEARAKLYQQRLSEDRDKAALFTEYGDIEGVGAGIIKTLLDWKPRVTDTMKAIKNNPFSLLENSNIGFTTADKFREHHGFPLNDENRIMHGIMYYLDEMFKSSGDTYEDIFVASKLIAKKLFVSYREVILLLSEIQHGNLALKYGLKIIGKNITTEKLFNAESLIYHKMNQLIKDKKNIANPKLWERNKKEYLEKLTEKLASEQEDFVDLVNKERVTVLLGPGGSGKSWVIKIVCDLIQQSGKTYGLFAPTARAAHVMSEYVGVEAATIHRGLLGYAMEEEVAPYDVLIVDEFSMTDSELASVILKVMGTQTRLIIIGDDFQLQSVGPGNVLFDIVEFIGVPTVRLTQIFRQTKGSGILDYASDLRNSSFCLPASAPRIEEDDIIFINESDDVRQRDIAISLYNKAESRYEVGDLMLLSPINKGISGRGILNKRIQQLVNPQRGSNEVVFGGNLDDEDHKTYFRKGDYITVKSNNYDMISDLGEVTSIINGDMGTIEHATTKDITFGVNGHSYTIDKSEIFDLIDHAWCITIHKSQGGQASEVVIVLPQNSLFMLNANMLYTAITRTKVKCYVIGNFAGINKAAKKLANFNRKTMIQLQSLAKDKNS